MRPAERDRLADTLSAVLTARPGLDKHALRRALEAAGWSNVDTSDINSVLYESGRPFAWTGVSTHRLWHVTTVDSAAKTPAQRPSRTGWSTPRSYAGHALRAWQEQALQAWAAGGCRGVVEAVTGTGKTAVGVAAAAHALDCGLRVTVVVPTRDLLDQWHGVLRRDIPGVGVGRLGDGWSDSLSSHRLLVTTVQSASKRPMLRESAPALLVADEVHRYGADSFSKALEPGYTARLGLTATYARDDDGLTRHLQPYFGQVVAGCDYRRGLDEKILAPFRVATLGRGFLGGGAVCVRRI